MSKKYPMMVTLAEASKIYTSRAAKSRKREGFPPILPPTHSPLHTTKKKIRNAVTLVLLADEILPVPYK